MSTEDKQPSKKALKKLLTFYQESQYDAAEKLAVLITEKFPNHQFAWKILGALYIQTDRPTKSLFAAQKSTQLKPQDAKAQYNLGTIFNQLGRFDKAAACFKKAVTLKPDYFEALRNLANAFQTLGRLDEAEVNYKKAIKLKPDYAIAHNNLAIIIQESGRLDEAIESYKKAINLKPDFAEAYYNLGIVLQELSRLDDAERNYRHAIEIRPDYTIAHNQLLRCLYLQNKKISFINELEFLLNKNKPNAVIGSFIARAKLKYGVEKLNIFCSDPLKYVVHTDLNIQYDFKKIFVQSVKNILDKKLLPLRSQSLLVNGYQTYGNLFDLDNEFIQEIKKVILLEIEQYLFSFKESKEGFIKKWPEDYSLYGWLIGMRSGGELKPHIHDQGWLSGSIYINVPSKTQPDSGNLVVCIGNDKESNSIHSMERKIDIVTGSLVLFPASLTHYTIPFESTEERVVLAFDVK